MGEGMGNEALLMPYITSANIACGYHAGNEQTMDEVIRLCIKHGVKIGAHPSFAHKESFGRTELELPPDEIYSLINEQLLLLNAILKKQGGKLHHVKPHGALYNMAAKDISIAAAIAQATKDFDASLMLYGLSGSVMITTAESIGLKTASEVFADRTYQDDGSLTPRNQPHALITDINEAVKQVIMMTVEKKVVTTSGKEINITADTICIHGDGKHALEFARAIHQHLL